MENYILHEALVIIITYHKKFTTGYEIRGVIKQDNQLDY